MDSAAMIYIPTFIKIGSGVQKLIAEIIQIYTKDWDFMSLLQESWPKMKNIQEINILFESEI
jgi:hypothetical protein